MTEHVTISHADGVVHLALNRPEKKNALTGAMYLAMIEAIERADGDAATAAIVFSGAPGAFTAGNDIADFLAGSSDLRAAPPFRFIRAIAACATPLIAAVDGLAIGVGATMILHCDLAFASARSHFRMPFIDLALVPEAASSLLLPRRVGLAKASEFLLLGEGFDAAEAHRLGLINAVVPEGELLDHALAKARKLASLPREALAASRRLLRGDAAEILARIDLEGEAFERQTRSPEAREMFVKFLNRAKR